MRDYIMKNENVLLAMTGMAMLSAEAIAQKPANIILINLDDAGNGDFSCRGQSVIRLRISTGWLPTGCQ